MWTIMQKLLKIGLLAYVSLLFSFVGVMGSTETSYAMSSKSLVEIGLLPGVTLDVLSTPTSTPAATPTSAVTSTPAATQSPQATPTSQARPFPTGAALPSYTAKPTSTSVSAKSTTVGATGGAIFPVSITIHLPNAEELNINIFKLFLLLGVVGPLLMISGGTLWLLVKWLINKRKLALQGTIQASPSVNSADGQSALHILQSASNTPPSILAPSTETSEVPMQVPPAQPIYTPSKLHPITTACSLQMLAVHSGDLVSSPLNSDVEPLQIGSPDLSLGIPRAIESNGNAQRPLVLASPTALVDAPSSSVPSSPPVSSASSVAI
jgi:hypothetical protein